MGESLQEIQHLQIPRSYSPVSPAYAKFIEPCVFLDASEKVVAAVT